MDSRVVRCGSCKAELHETLSEEPVEHPPCPHCGSTSRLVEQPLSAPVTSHPSISAKAKLPKGRWFMFQKVGESRVTR